MNDSTIARSTNPSRISVSWWSEHVSCSRTARYRRRFSLVSLHWNQSSATVTRSRAPSPTDWRSSPRVLWRRGLRKSRNSSRKFTRAVAATFTEGSKFPKTTSKRYGPSSGQRLRPSFSFRRIRAIGDQVSIQSWLRKLDHFYASVAADETPPASKFKENGLVPPPMD
jgi:hypothetical protein